MTTSLTKDFASPLTYANAISAAEGAMTFLSLLGMLAGLGILMFLPLSKDRLIRQLSQGLGGVLFSAGLVGFIFTIV